MLIRAGFGLCTGFGSEIEHTTHNIVFYLRAALSIIGFILMTAGWWKVIKAYSD
jgi:hypothetical protein